MKSWRILVVDDDPVYAEALSLALRRRGHAVASAYDADAALTAMSAGLPGRAGAEAFDAAILDLRLATQSGLQLITPLLALQPALRIVLLTGFASIATAVEAIKLGATHYLVKPATAADILAAIERTSGNDTVAPADDPLSVERLEWEHIQQVLAAHEGNLSATARALKMHRRTLQRKLAKRPVRE